MLTGKGNHLDRIVEVLGPKVTPPYVRLRGDDLDLVRKAKRFIKWGWRELLLRSDSSYESSGPGKSFAGMSLSPRVETYTHSKKVAIMSAVKRSQEHRVQHAEKIRKYADFRGVDISDAHDDYILHKRADGVPITLMEHPNHPGYFQVEEGTRPWLSARLGQVSNFALDVKILIHDYLRLSNAMDASISYVMEAAYVDGVPQIFQMTPAFRKKPLDHKPAIHQFGKIPINVPIEPVGTQHVYNIARNSETGGLVLFASYQHVRSFTPPDVALGKKLEGLVITNYMGSPHWIDHIGLRTLEGVEWASFQNDIPFDFRGRPKFTDYSPFVFDGQEWSSK